MDVPRVLVCAMTCFPFGGPSFFSNTLSTLLFRGDETVVLGSTHFSPGTPPFILASRMGSLSALSHRVDSIQTSCGTPVPSPSTTEIRYLTSEINRDVSLIKVFCNLLHAVVPCGAMLAKYAHREVKAMKWKDPPEAEKPYEIQGSKRSGLLGGNVMEK